MGFKIPRAGWFIALLVLVFAAVWALLSLFHSPYADWLTVETPAYALVGNPMDVRLTLGSIPEPSVLVVNLYTLGKNHKPVGQLKTPGSVPSAQSGGSYTFRIEVTHQEKIAFIQLVIWVSPTGDWRTRTRGAYSEAIPVRVPEAAKVSSALKKIRAFAIPNAPNPETPFVPGGRPPEPEVFHGSSVPFLWTLAALLAAGGLVCGVNAVRRRADRVPGTKGEWRLWFGTAAVLFLAVFWEAFRVTGRLSRLGRRLVVALDVYYARQSYQRILLALIAALLAGLLILAARAITRRRVSPYITAIAALLVFYFSASFAGALSFHYVDVLRGVSLAGISVVDAAKGISAVAVLVLGLLALRKEKV